MRDRFNVIPFRRAPNKRRRLEDPQDTSPLGKLQQMLKHEALHESEARAMYDEVEFKRRYAATWSRRDREWLLDFQLEQGLSDREIRWLNRSKSLRVTASGINLIASIGMAAYGWVCIVVLWVFVGVPLFGDTYFARSAAPAALFLSIGVLVLVQMTRWMWAFYILPRHIMRHFSDRKRS